MKYTALLLLTFCFLGFACTSDESQKITDDPNLKPEANRFTKSILTKGLDEPMEMTFLPDDRVLLVERKGGVKLFDEKTNTLSLVATIPVNTKYKNKKGHVREAEEGLMGVIAHPDYAGNHWVFMYYADPDEPKHVLARWELKGTELVEASKQVVLEVPTQREECCHTGGGMVFDAAGNLYLTVGNNTVNPRNGASNLDERPGHENSDDQRGPSNSNDLRGKILRIHPEDDGSYTIPAGNLFAEGTPNARPEIYTMGHRNPWRPTLDSKTGYLYWGEVGPDAAKDSIWGPKGYDEFNQAKGPGFFGWPYFIGNNRPYNHYNAEAMEYGAPFDVVKPVNHSVNNTGLKELPAPVPAMIYYPYGPSPEFPLVGSAGRSATGGPVYRRADFKNAERSFPAYYEGKWLIVDFMRDWIMAVEMDAEGNYKGLERFLPDMTFSAAIDMDFGPSGDLYVLEYGDAWFKGNPNAQLVKVEYNAGNRKPMVVASADRLSGAVPFEVQFSSEGTVDYDTYDQDKLKYIWKLSSDNGIIKTFNDANPMMRFEKPGIYKVSLTVNDSRGDSNSSNFEIVAGNEAPTVAIDLKGVNESFYFGDASLLYAITINDREDGSTGDGSIKAEEVAITFDYVPAGFDPIEIRSRQSGADLLAVDAIARNQIESSDCKSCHQYEAKSIGPSYVEVAAKYENTLANRAMLAGRIINGSIGIWGEHAMAAHPQLSLNDAARMVRYIMSYSDEKPTLQQLALDGTLRPDLPKGEDGDGRFVLRAAYQDKGAAGMKALAGEAEVALRNPVVMPWDAEYTNNTQHLTTPRTSFLALGPESHIGFASLDLTGVQEVAVFVRTSPRVGSRGGVAELRLDAPDGELIGVSDRVGQKEFPRGGWGGSQQNMTPEERKIARRKRMSRLSIYLDGIVGTRDVYLVFKNADAQGNEILMTINEIEFYSNREQDEI